MCHFLKITKSTKSVHRTTAYCSTLICCMIYFQALCGGRNGGGKRSLICRDLHPFYPGRDSSDLYYEGIYAPSTQLGTAAISHL